MADTKISALTELAATPADADELVVVDKSDTTDAASGTTKRIQRSNLVGGLAKTAPIVDMTAINGLLANTHAGIPGAYMYNDSAAAGTADRLHYSLFVPETDLRITAYYYEINSGNAAGTVRVGITELDADLFPATSGVIGEDATTDPSTTGTKSATGLTWDLTAGKRYCTLFVASLALNVDNAGITGPSWPIWAAGNIRKVQWLYQNSLGTGAFGATVSDPTAVAGTDNEALANQHFVWFDWEAQP